MPPDFMLVLPIGARMRFSDAQCNIIEAQRLLKCLDGSMILQLGADIVLAAVNGQEN